MFFFFVYFKLVSFSVQDVKNDQTEAFNLGKLKKQIEKRTRKKKQIWKNSKKFQDCFSLVIAHHFSAYTHRLS